MYVYVFRDDHPLFVKCICVLFPILERSRDAVANYRQIMAPKRLAPTHGAGFCLKLQQLQYVFPRTNNFPCFSCSVLEWQGE